MSTGLGKTFVVELAGTQLRIEELPHELLRQYTNAEQTLRAAADAREAAGSVRGSMRWKMVNGRDYLIRVSPSGAEKSLGPRTPENEATYAHFMNRRERFRLHAASLQNEVEQTERLNKAWRLGRADPIFVRLLVGLEKHSLSSHFRVVGTHAMYAYESAAGVRLGDAAMETRELDLLWDVRSRVTFHTQLERTEFKSMVRMIKAIDPSFEVMAHQPYSVVNKDGFMVDIILRERRDGEPHPIRMSDDEEDLWPVEAQRANVLQDSRPFRAMVVATSGKMAMVNTIDPLTFASFKRWMSGRPNRDAAKRRRDELQAATVEYLVERYLPQWLPQPSPSPDEHAGPAPV
jgi:hypothetical protein